MPKPGDKQCWDWPGSTLSKSCFVASRDDWEAFALGWAHGVSTGVEDLPVAAAIYVNQSEYNQEGIASFGLSVILAEGLPGPAAPLKGLPIVGYAAFYSTCQNVPANISKVFRAGVAWSSLSSLLAVVSTARLTASIRVSAV